MHLLHIRSYYWNKANEQNMNSTEKHKSINIYLACALCCCFPERILEIRGLTMETATLMFPRSSHFHFSCHFRNKIIVFYADSYRILICVYLSYSSLNPRYWLIEPGLRTTALLDCFKINVSLLWKTDYWMYRVVDLILKYYFGDFISVEIFNL